MKRLQVAVNALLVSVARTNQDAAPVRYALTECIDNKQSLYYYSDTAINCSVATRQSLLYKPPVHGLRCDLHCEMGYYRGITLEPKPIASCKKCKNGTYSLGGGMLFSETTNAWRDPLPYQFHTECSTHSIINSEWEHECAPWAASENGSMISSGHNPDILQKYGASRLFSTLRLTTTFVRNGTITYQYRVEAEKPYDGLLFQLDDVADPPVISQTNGWVEATHKVGTGTHTFTWDFTKDFNNDVGRDRVDIKVIELIGTSYADTTCHPCGSAGSSSDAICAFCGEDEYAAPKSESELEFTCKPCPSETFAPKGSIGSDSCTELHACTTSDLIEAYSECKNGVRNMTYTWSEPPTCRKDLPKSIQLPKPILNIRCDQCDAGYVYSKSQLCATCPKGEYLGTEKKCVTCDSNQVVVYQQTYGVGTNAGWSEWPSIIDKDEALKGGWKLTKNGIVHTRKRKHEKKIMDGRERIEIPVRVEFAYPGYINITLFVDGYNNETSWAVFELKVTNLKYEMGSNMPTTSAPSTLTFVDLQNKEEEDKEELFTTQIIDLTADIARSSNVSKTVPILVTEPSVVNLTIAFFGTPGSLRHIDARLQSITLYGTSTGGAVDCVKCPAGTGAIRDEANSTTQCQTCPGGTFSSPLSRHSLSCMQCPENSFSFPGSSHCHHCGHNLFSPKASSSCSAPAVLAAQSNPHIRYNLSLIQSLAYNNHSFKENAEDIFMYAPAIGLQSTTLGPVESRETFILAPTYHMMTGLFRPLSASWEENVVGQIVEDKTKDDQTPPYIIYLETETDKAASSTFIEDSKVYGRVECAIPPHIRAWSGGALSNVQANDDGSGLTLFYTNGSKCRDQEGNISTTLHLTCDVNARSQGPIVVDAEDLCRVELSWRTPYACSICHESFFSEYKTACTQGTQAVTFSNDLECFGGEQRTSIPIRTCNEMVLDAKAIQHVYFGIFLIVFLVLVLVLMIYMMYRRYRSTYEEYIYLKAKIPTQQRDTEDGGKETVYEFGNGNAPLQTPNSTDEGQSDEDTENPKQVQAV